MGENAYVGKNRNSNFRVEKWNSLVDNSLLVTQEGKQTVARILMVDDDKSYLEAASRYLELCGQTVESVTDGRNAMQILLAAVPDLIILDLRLPGIDGCSIVEIIRSYLRLQRLPILILSSLVGGPMVDRARELKVNDILDMGATTLERLAEIVQEQLQNGWG